MVGSKIIDIKDLILAPKPVLAPLPSAIPELDELLEGGLREGEISEWGMPWGQSLRDIILPFLVSAQQRNQYWVLWIYGRKQIGINPLAWQSRAIDLKLIRFAQSQQPLKDLRPVFLSDLFRVIVIDQAQAFTDDDYAFLARQVRQQRQHLLILHDAPLSQMQGNVWAKLRVNCQQDFQRQRIIAQILKGRRPQQIDLPLPGLH